MRKHTQISLKPSKTMMNRAHPGLWGSLLLLFFILFFFCFLFMFFFHYFFINFLFFKSIYSSKYHPPLHLSPTYPNRRTTCLKYLVLANMLMKSGINPFDSQEAKPYKNNSEILAMTNLVRSGVNTL